ncbi:MAG TPA: hypothetical protein VN843_16955 [Anaerolineales bacterium]|nr:hypothetical protein [Anaerolineales bacterium]
MVDTSSLLALTRSIEEAPTSAPPLERWLDRAKELQNELSWRVVSLSRYLDELPQSSYTTYADALISTLRDPDVEARVGDLSDFRSSFREFASRLENCGYQEKAELVRRAVDGESHSLK